MSLVKIKYESDRVRQAIRQPEGFWLVEIDGKRYPYDDDEVIRVPAHRSEYDPDHWGEVSQEDAEQYDYFGKPRHRKEGPAT